MTLRAKPVGAMQAVMATKAHEPTMAKHILAGDVTMTPNAAQYDKVVKVKPSLAAKAAAIPETDDSIHSEKPAEVSPANGSPKGAKLSHGEASSQVEVAVQTNAAPSSENRLHIPSLLDKPKRAFEALQT